MKIVVLMGGRSDERDVSLHTGAQVADALRRAGHEAMAVDTVSGPLDPDAERELLEGGVGAHEPSRQELDAMDESHTVSLVRDPELGHVDAFFLALHGGSGEDGTLQALLDVAGVTYTGSDRLGCSLAMDKEVTKRLLAQAGIPTPKWLTGEPTVDEVEASLGLPVVVKASGGGSSLRLVLAHDREELAAAIEESRNWDDVVLFEEFITGRELTVPVLGDEALPVGEIIPENEMFDYECKYQPGMAQEIFPADIPDAVAARAQELSLRVRDCLRLRDYCRVDFMLSDDGELWCLEANTLPGMTAASLYPRGAKAAGIAFPQLCERLVELAVARSAPSPA